MGPVEIRRRNLICLMTPIDKGASASIYWKACLIHASRLDKLMAGDRL